MRKLKHYIKLCLFILFTAIGITVVSIGIMATVYALLITFVIPPDAFRGIL